MRELVNRLRSTVLPECFEIGLSTVTFENLEEFSSLLKDPGEFMSLVGENTAVNDSRAWVDIYESGFIAAIALSLWFMEFDEDNWFSFEDIHAALSASFRNRSRISQRLELRLVKGNYPPMMLDQPVLVDHEKGEISFLFGKLND